MTFSNAASAVREVVPAGIASAVTTAGGAALTQPPWLIALGQAVIVIWFTVRAIDKRMSNLHRQVNEVKGVTESLTARLNALQCINGGCQPPHPPQS